jgi:CheY-like chemotaxis protein
MSAIIKMPVVWLVGDAKHPDFCAAVELLSGTATVQRFDDVARAGERLALELIPDLIVLAASRPGMVGARDVEQLRRRLPLAGIVSLLGSWCEGETRTGRPVKGVLRTYWYDFPNLWRRQLALRALGCCPDWARPATDDWHGLSAGVIERGASVGGGLVVLHTTCWETGDALSDVLRAAGYATIWIAAGVHGQQIRGAVAGIWEGRQLDEPEVCQLAGFCRRLAEDGAPVIALADFPRRDRCEAAYQAGAAVVLSKPWLNADLLLALERLVRREGRDISVPLVARAA